MIVDFDVGDRQGRASLKSYKLLSLEQASHVLATQSWGMGPSRASQRPSAVFMHVLCRKTLVGLYIVLRAPQFTGLFEKMGTLWDENPLYVLPRLLGSIHIDLAILSGCMFKYQSKLGICIAAGRNRLTI
jgi:hypothetical protein